LEKEGKTINGKKIITIPFSEVLYTGSTRYIHEKNRDKSNKQKIVVRQMLEKFPTGTYIVLVRNHAFTLIDGVIIGNLEDGKKMKVKVLNLVKIE